MELFYYKSDIGNFGDDMNPWLWNQLLGSFSEYRSGVQFVGIGSILDERLDNGRKKVVFGSGIRDKKYKPKTPSDFDFRFVRGPRSGESLGQKFICDSAYCLRLLEDTGFKTSRKISFIPYFRHYHNVQWDKFSELTGFYVINPTQHIEKVIEEIQSTEYVISCAMHGAILADVYRKPWIRCRAGIHGHENRSTSELKWSDFSSALGMEKISTLEVDMNINTRRWFNDYLNSRNHEKLALAIKSKALNFVLSGDSVVKEKEEQLYNAIEQFKKDYRR